MQSEFSNSGLLRGLYFITGANTEGSSADSPSKDGSVKDSITDKVAAALQGGCRLIQFRAKHLPNHQRMQQAAELMELCREYGASLLINDDIKLAKIIGANGVHLGQQDSSIREARSALGNKAMIGITCHNSLELAHKAEQQGADYVAFGRFFPSRTKPDAPPAELTTLQQAKQQLSIPIVAIGGITLDNARLVIDQGADMVAVIHDLFGLGDTATIAERARAYCHLF